MLFSFIVRLELKQIRSVAVFLLSCRFVYVPEQFLQRRVLIGHEGERHVEAQAPPPPHTTSNFEFQKIFTQEVSLRGYDGYGLLHRFM